MLQESVFSYYFGTPRALPSIPESGFQQFQYIIPASQVFSKTQPPDSVKDLTKEYLGIPGTLGLLRTENN